MMYDCVLSGYTSVLVQDGSLPIWVYVCVNSGMISVLVLTAHSPEKKLEYWAQTEG